MAAIWCIREHKVLEDYRIQVDRVLVALTLKSTMLPVEEAEFCRAGQAQGQAPLLEHLAASFP